MQIYLAKHLTIQQFDVRSVEKNPKQIIQKVLKRFLARVNKIIRQGKKVIKKIIRED